MVEFNDLRISRDGKELFIEVSIKNEHYYKDLYIDSIIIDNQDTFVDTKPSTTPIYLKTIDGSEKSIKLCLSIDDLLVSLTDNLFFIYIRTKGVVTPDTPCGKDMNTTMSVICYSKGFSNKLLEIYKCEKETKCTVPMNFISYYLMLEALYHSLRVSKFRDSIRYYKELVNNGDYFNNISNSECHGCR